PDLIVTSLNKKINLYLNDGKGHFHLDKKSGLGASHGATSIALADINGDGNLDLYITNYRKRSARDVFPPRQLGLKNTTIKKANGTFRLKPRFKPYYTILRTKKGQSFRRKIGRKDELFINQGGKGKNWGGFRKVKNLKKHFLSSKGKPMGLKPYWGLTAKFYDINGDGRPDLYVCNDYWTPDRVWLNQGNGVFKALGTKNLRNFTYSSMSVAFSDINADGRPDFFVSGMLSPVHQRRLRQSSSEGFASGPGAFLKRPQYNRNSLYLNRGDSTFAEIANYSGVAASGWSWASKFMDVNLDGYPDLIVNTGDWFDLLDMDTQYHTRQEIINGSMKNENYLFQFPPLKLVNKVYRNNGNLSFSNESKNWGFHDKDVSQGMATADLDNDGDLDIVDNRLKQTAAIYENTTSAPRIEIRLKGQPPNTQAIGTKLKLTGGKVPQQRQVTSGGGYESGSAPDEMFAANGSSPFYHLTVRWPNGSVTRLDSIKANRMYEIDEPASGGGNSQRHSKMANKETHHTLFQNVSGKISYSHHEDPYPDFKVQALLPERLSQEGPGVGWIDYNGDGNEDLWITSGKGGKTGIFKNTGNGKFKHISLPGISHTAPGDQTSIVGWNTQKSTYVVIGNANFEQKNARVPSAHIYKINSSNHVSKQLIPGIPSTTGPVAAADYDGDGTVDLFIGGRFLPYFYPEDATSRLFKNESGHFVLDKANADTFKKVGMVTSAVFCDINEDGEPDLILATEWGPIKIFINKNGIFHDETKKWGLNKYDGWWKGLAVGDFNNDGKMDIVATNIGTNNSYRSELTKNHPLRMYYGDLNGNHHVDIIESYYDSTLQGYVPRRRAYAFKSAAPSVVQNISSNKQFAHSTLYDLLGDNLNLIHYKKVNTLKSMVFINKGGHFSAHPLPQKAQLSPAFYAGVADVNNDGNEDIFLSQNFSALPNETPHMNAGRGLWLEGDGNGHFKAVSGNSSG
ncbi:MAG TPA: VCBS repeat-containing protein, partial [Balneolaceae bacterium]|nr:VCBS repeat-containing protein [Balneolaceae bacterium]